MKDKWPLIPMTLGLLGPFLVFMSACGYPALAIVGKITWVVGAVGSIGGGVAIYFREQRQTALLCVIAGLVLLAALLVFHRFAGLTTSA
jgi:hypothetical protein